MSSTLQILLPVMAGIIVILLVVLLSVVLASRKIQREDMRFLSDHVADRQELLMEMQDRRLSDMSESQDARLRDMSEQISKMALENEQKLEQIRRSVEERISALQQDNNRQLEQMRNTVDEKLQETLESRISKSFELVNNRLQEVYTGLGEMRDLASGVGDLKKVLSNVKTRGILGEVQLAAILGQILAPEQYEENVETIPGSGKRVEFAVRLPGEGDGVVYLPIDSKFPLDAYRHLLDASDTGDKDLVAAARKNLRNTVLSFAKYIRDKYVQVPYTTDFGILFLPTEGLYAEVVNMGLVEELQNWYLINIAGPTTMAALLNSLQMGFRTLAIQQHSSQVWETLAAVKTEFEKFGDALAKAQKKIDGAHEDLDKLIGTRSNAIRRKLREVETLSDADSLRVLEAEDWQDLTGPYAMFDEE